MLKNCSSIALVSLGYLYISIIFKKSPCSQIQKLVYLTLTDGFKSRDADIKSACILGLTNLLKYQINNNGLRFSILQLLSDKSENIDIQKTLDQSLRILNSKKYSSFKERFELGYYWDSDLCFEISNSLSRITSTPKVSESIKPVNVKKEKLHKIVAEKIEPNEGIGFKTLKVFENLKDLDFFVTDCNQQYLDLHHELHPDSKIALPSTIFQLKMFKRDFPVVSQQSTQKRKLYVKAKK